MKKLMLECVPIFLGLALYNGAASAEDIPAGTVISAANFEQFEGQFFDGHRLGDLLTDNYKLWIREHGLTLKLKHAVPLEIDPRYAQYTAQYAKQVRFNPETKKVDNYTAGIPFPR